MPLIADTYPYVVGVDTHARSHTYCLIESDRGAIVDSASFPTSVAGIRRALTWLLARTEAGPVFAAVEGTSSYGASLTAALTDVGVVVGEIRPGPRSSHAHHGKSDLLDAESAARAALARDITHVPQPRATGARTMLRVLLAARGLIDQQRTANRNALLALLRTVPLGLDVRGPLHQPQIRQVAAWRPQSGDPLSPARSEAKRLAAAVLDQDLLLRENHQHLAALVEQLTPGLQAVRGVGPVTAAIIVCAYSHHGRLRDEAAFAALGGVAPLPASSGNIERHRLNRSGDRQLNRALDVIVRSRLSCDTDTQAYLARSVAAGKTRREARRNLKRYVARSIFRQLRSMPALT